MKEHAKLHKKDSPLINDWRNKRTKADKYVKQQPELLDYLNKIAEICDRHLRRITATKHSILQTDNNFHPVRCAKYKARSTARQFAARKFYRILQEEAIKSARTEWENPILLAPEKEDFFRFGVNYRKLKAVTIRHSYPLPGMYDCIELLVEAHVFSTSDTFSGCFQVEID